MNIEQDSSKKFSQVEQNQQSPIFSPEELQQKGKEQLMKEQRCQAILGYVLPSSHNLIANQDATTDLASFSNLISSVGLAEHQVIYDQQALKLKIRRQQQMLKREQQQRQSKLFQLLQDRSIKSQMLNPQQYIEMVQNGTKSHSKDEQLDEQLQFDTFYNQNRITFNRLHFLPNQ